MLKAQPLGDMCSMEDVAKVVAFLASDLACGMTGTCVPVDRGNLIVPPDPDMPETPRNVGNVNDVATQLGLDQLAAYGPDEITSPHTNGRHH
ncbi:hypothetical protein BaRGS_00028183 [Batillaria attramentaria]|uniref:Uncharacterized protein n=1 Tax=Batillaria attramentaria TaxID=370345 RepID=A0ABD0JZX7_9CAEN